MEDSIHSVDSHGHDGHFQPGADHADAAAERQHVSRIGARALWKDQNRPVRPCQVADVLERLPGAGLALWQRERVEIERGEIVQQAALEPLPAAVRGRERRRPSLAACSTTDPIEYAIP